MIELHPSIKSAWGKQKTLLLLRRYFDQITEEEKARGILPAEQRLLDALK
jgi:hypothetical protein